MTENEVVPSWPDNWREQFSAGDGDALQSLQRLDSPIAMYHDWRLMEKHRNDPKPAYVPARYEFADYENAITSDDIATHGVENVSKVLAWTEALGLPPACAVSLLPKYIEGDRGLRNAEMERDEANKQSCLEELGEEWGEDFDQNRNLINLLMFSHREIVDIFQSSRQKDGLRLDHEPRLLRFLANVAEEKYPDGNVTITPNSGMGGSGILDEIAAIEKEMSNTTGPYWHGPQASEMQARYRELITMRDRK